MNPLKHWQMQAKKKLKKKKLPVKNLGLISNMQFKRKGD